MFQRLACLLGCCLLAWCPAAMAQTHFITDTIQVTLRSGPAMDRKIIALLDSGQPLEIMEKGDEWSQIRLPSGREGWVLTRLIQTDTPLKTQLAALQERYDALLDQSGMPSAEMKKLENDKAALSKQLAQARQELSGLTEAKRQLEAALADADAIQTHRNRLVKELAESRGQAAGLTREITAARSKRNIWWFLSGAGVLVLGLLIGLSMRSRRKRSSYY
jgi:SH3 domain protein